MAEVLLLHSALGRTPGCVALADDLRAGGHVVHVPDLYDGATFTTVEEGVAHAQAIGFGTVRERGVRAAEGLPTALVYAGESLGVLPAQQLAQTRPGARGALLLSGCVTPEDLGAPWPPEVPVQVHGMTGDPLFADEGDLDAARALVASAADAELFVYDGTGHLFAERGGPDHDPQAAGLLVQRLLAFLDRLA